MRDGGRVVGAATLVTFPLPSGLRGRVDDVVVDESTRGKGIARAPGAHHRTRHHSRAPHPRSHIAAFTRIGPAAL
ncbi:GNAT family N-acetyltransferase [Microbacterium foliorum]|uniref:GNAT family N-acetyltransferase n=1 Tax=Microbacterium foliorum TaxID=104336 RepID=UPI001E3DA917|nr:GNAT family N-acetyltransferase [Microbacterium foliorum]